MDHIKSLGKGTGSGIVSSANARLFLSLEVSCCFVLLSPSISCVDAIRVTSAEVWGISFRIGTLLG